MAARLPRRSFAAPFVVTLATLPGCYVQSSTSASTGPGPRQPPPATNTPTAVTPPPVGPQPAPNDQVVVANPPRPTTEPAQPVQPTRPSPANTTTAPADPTRPGDKVIVVANPPPPTTAQPAKPARPSPANTTTAPAEPVRPTATPERRWTVMRTKGQCKAYVDTACPTAPKGQPQPTCNPPPPTAYACPDFLADGGNLKLVQRANETTCTVDYGPLSCPKGAICNPPPPRQVSCPK